MVMTMAEVHDIVEVLKDMQEDNTVPKNVKTKLTEIEAMLNSDGEKSMNVNKAIDILVDITDDVNLQAYVRTRLLNIVSMLESM